MWLTRVNPFIHFVISSLKKMSAATRHFGPGFCIIHVLDWFTITSASFELWTFGFWQYFPQEFPPVAMLRSISRHGKKEILSLFAMFQACLESWERPKASQWAKMVAVMLCQHHTVCQHQHLTYNVGWRLPRGWIWKFFNANMLRWTDVHIAFLRGCFNVEFTSICNVEKMSTSDVVSTSVKVGWRLPRGFLFNWYSDQGNCQYATTDALKELTFPQS